MSKEKEKNVDELNDVSNEEVKENVNIKDTPSDEIDIEALNEVIEEKEKEAKDNLDKYLRTMAEYDNFRKRTIKEKSDMYDKGIMDSTSKFLEILDNFKRALQQFKPEELTEKEKNMYDGLVLLEKQFMQILTSIGVNEIEAVGQEFNPELHNAITHAEDETLGENIVSEEFQKGYMYNDKVIRYSQVKVVN